MRTFALLLAGLLLAPSPTTAQDETASVVAHLRIEPGDGDYLAWADNLLAGPVEVRLESSGSAPPSEPMLPARASIPAGGSALVARLKPASGRNGLMQLRLTGVPGSSNARPRDVEYLPPLREPEMRIDQGFEGAFSHHDDENRHALDFATGIGTPVHAARAGTVMQVEAGFHGNGLDYRRDAARSNFIRILHDDGTMALYAHLAHDGVLVRPGQQVQAGERIGMSGNTGYSTAPHLHFVVQVNRGGRLQSVPFRMHGVLTTH
ncbi:MAG: M23 family metallopeptidase [Thermomonas sp.]|uniref:M23 family metallopeptidase n=1 Tax=Thermomonas sp. TaxID=1971895 RepID=UPI0039E6111E